MGVPQRGDSGESRLGGVCAVCPLHRHIYLLPPLLHCFSLHGWMTLFPCCPLSDCPHVGARDLVCTLSLNAFAYAHGHPQLFCTRQRNIAANGQNPFITGSIMHFLVWLRLSSSSKRVMVTRVMVCIACACTHSSCACTHARNGGFCAPTLSSTGGSCSLHRDTKH